MKPFQEHALPFRFPLPSHLSKGRRGPEKGGPQREEPKKRRDPVLRCIPKSQFFREKAKSKREGPGGPVFVWIPKTQCSDIHGVSPSKPFQEVLAWNRDPLSID